MMRQTAPPARATVPAVRRMAWWMASGDRQGWHDLVSHCARCLFLGCLPGPPACLAAPLLNVSPVSVVETGERLVSGLWSGAVRLCEYAAGRGVKTASCHVLGAPRAHTQIRAQRGCRTAESRVPQVSPRPRERAGIHSRAVWAGVGRAVWVSHPGQVGDRAGQLCGSVRAGQGGRAGQGRAQQLGLQRSAAWSLGSIPRV
mmetsp:Transcript_27954/g.82230  ORF Transcript_27954/g.82230 Transcript_27954/m.82230 type:complete len:201 (+) Transcript_27954:924-1526(+)